MRAADVEQPLVVCKYQAVSSGRPLVLVLLLAPWTFSRLYLSVVEVATPSLPSLRRGCGCGLLREGEQKRRR